MLPMLVALSKVLREVQVTEKKRHQGLLHTGNCVEGTFTSRGPLKEEHLRERSCLRTRRTVRVSLRPALGSVMSSVQWFVYCVSVHAGS